MSELICTVCGKPREIGRRICRDCHLSLQRKRAQKRYAEQGNARYGTMHCIKCGKEIIKSHKNQRFCKLCAQSLGYSSAKNTYVYTFYGFMHRNVAEAVLGRELLSSEIIHHLDEDVQNNKPDNLAVMDSPTHSKLHYYLKIKHFELEQYGSMHWNTVVCSISKDYLRDIQASVVYLGECPNAYEAYSRVCEWVESTCTAKKEKAARIEERIKARSAILHCRKCGVKICNNTKTGMCKKCQSNTVRKVERPSYAQLLEDRKTLSFCAIGRKYGVTDNAIRKWIRYYEKTGAGGEI